MNARSVIGPLAHTSRRRESAPCTQQSEAGIGAELRCPLPIAHSGLGAVRSSARSFPRASSSASVPRDWPPSHRHPPRSQRKDCVPLGKGLDLVADPV